MEAPLSSPLLTPSEYWGGAEGRQSPGQASEAIFMDSWSLANSFCLLPFFVIAESHCPVACSLLDAFFAVVNLYPGSGSTQSVLG